MENRVVDKLANYAGQNRLELTVFDTIPSFLILDVMYDCVGVEFPRSIGMD